MSIDLGMAGTRYLNGQVLRCKLIGRASATSRYYISRAGVRPLLWYLTQTTDSKIFQEKSVPGVIRGVTGHYGVTTAVQMHCSTSEGRRVGEGGVTEC